MKRVYRNILGVVLFLVIILLIGGVIFSLVDFAIKDKINSALLLLIKWVLIFILITLLLKTRTGKNLEESIFGKRLSK